MARTGDSMRALSLAVVTYAMTAWCSVVPPIEHNPAERINKTSADPRILMPRGWDDGPFPIVTGYVAFGDSVAAGLGAGQYETGNRACRIGEYNYPYLLTWHEGQGSGIPDIQYLMCSGDKLPAVRTQIDNWVRPELADLATISMGANEIGFNDLAIECITRSKFFWGTGNCDEVQANARNLMRKRGGNDNLFTDMVAAYVSIARKATKPSFHLFVTGYAAFFNVDTDKCKDTTFFYFPGVFAPGYHPNHRDSKSPEDLYLTREHRADLNSIVMELNGFLQDAVNEANQILGSERVVFVDINASFDTHRFCEADNGVEVQEPDKSRQATWFFLPYWPDFFDPHFPPPASKYSAARHTMDLLFAQEQQRNQVDAWSDGGGYPLPSHDECTTQLSNPAGHDPWLDEQCLIVAAIEQGDSQVIAFLAAVNADIKAKKYSSQNIGAVYPTNMVKAFHPRSSGQWAIYLAVVDAWRRVTSPAEPPSSGVPCIGNQIEGSCVQGHLQDIPPNSGPQPPVCDKADDASNSLLRINAAKAAQAAADACAQLINEKIILSAASSLNLTPQVVQNAAEKGGTLMLTVQYDQDSCPSDKSTQVLDFAALGTAECQNNFYGVFEQVCAVDPTAGDYDADFSLLGGVYAGDCGLFSMSGQPAS